MPRTIRFHLDEHVPTVVADALIQRGIDVSTTEGVGLAGAEDREHCQFGLESGRMIITFDSDFLSLHSAGVRHHGVLYVVPSRNRDIGGIVRFTQLIWEILEPEDIVGRVEYF